MHAVKSPLEGSFEGSEVWGEVLKSAAERGGNLPISRLSPGKRNYIPPVETNAQKADSVRLCIDQSVPTSVTKGRKKLYGRSTSISVRDSGLSQRQAQPWSCALPTCRRVLASK